MGNKSVISKHLPNIFRENELDRPQLLQKMQQLDLMAPREESHFVGYKIY